MTWILFGSIAAVVAFVYCSFFEWALHKYLMHSDRFMKYPHRAHQLEHHDVFRADSTYILTEGLHDETALKHLTFAWWNAPLLIGLHAPILAAVFLWVGGWAAVVGATVSMFAYYALYEYLHYCMHVVKDRPFERSALFKFVQTHHRLHHVYFMKNLNVVIPIADFVLRTRVGLKDVGLFEKLEAARLRRLERAHTRAGTPA